MTRVVFDGLSARGAGPFKRFLAASEAIGHRCGSDRAGRSGVHGAAFDRLGGPRALKIH
jgi:hypothetical protein